MQNICITFGECRHNVFDVGRTLYKCYTTVLCCHTSLTVCYVSAMPGGGPRVVVSTAAFHARVRGSVPCLGGLKEVACSASDRQGSNFESCVWRTVSSQSSHHPQEVLLAQFSLYVHKGGLKPDSFYFSQPRQH